MNSRRATGQVWRQAVLAVAVLATAVVVVGAGPVSAATGDLTTFAGSLGEGLATRVAQDTPALAVRGRTLYLGGTTPEPSAGAVVRAVDLDTGQERVVAGSGEPGSGGDGGPATAARLWSVSDLDVDSAGNLFILDGDQGRVWRVDATGRITTVAGGGLGLEDGIAATEAYLPLAPAIAIGPTGDLYIADHENKIRRVESTGTISTVAGVGGSSAFDGDGGPAVDAHLVAPRALAFDAAGNLYIADGPRVRRVDSGGIITTVAGGGTVPFGTDDVPATDVELAPQGLAFDGQGNLLIADWRWVRKVDAGGRISTVAGNGADVFATDGTEVNPGDGSAAIDVPVAPTSLGIDSSSNLYVTEWGRARVRRVTPSGTITTVAGNGSRTLGGDGGTAGQAQLYRPTGVAFDRFGNGYIADSGNGHIRKVSSSGTISSLPDFLQYPLYVAVDDLGRVFTATSTEVWRMDPDGSIARVAGGGNADPAAGGRATDAAIRVVDIAVDRAGTLYIADARRVLAVNGLGVMTTVAGGGVIPPADGIPATTATLVPTGVQVDPLGDVVLADVNTQRIWRVGFGGLLSTVAGSSPGFSGDGGRATDAQLSFGIAGADVVHTGLAVDNGGQVFILDQNNQRVRRVDARGMITTVAGSGATIDTTSGYHNPAEGVPATSVPLAAAGIAVDGAGNLYLADAYLHRVRRVSGVALDSWGYHSVTPARLLDTRVGTGAPAEPVGPNEALTLGVTGAGGVPASGVSAVVLNVTVTQPTAAGFLTLYASGSARPDTANLTFVPGQTISNLVVAAVGPDGKVAIYNSAGSTAVVADVLGWYGA